MAKKDSNSHQPKQTHSQPQSAVTGFVTQDYANRHPNTTFTEAPIRRNNHRKV